MKNAKKAPGRVRIGNWYQSAMFGWQIKFKRLLKPFKAGVFGSAGGEFIGLKGV